MHELVLALIISAAPAEFVSKDDGFAVLLPGDPAVVTNGEHHSYIASDGVADGFVLIEVDPIARGSASPQTLRAQREITDTIRDGKRITVRKLATSTRTFSLTCSGMSSCKSLLSSFRFTR